MQLGELLDRRELIKGDAFFRETGAGGERVPVSVLRADRQCAEPATRGLTPFGDGGQSPLAGVLPLPLLVSFFGEAIAVVIFSRGAGACERIVCGGRFPVSR